ncbi:MAG: hypothetical protein ABIQ05_03970 [Candidatus Limnocylindria bacterium]
MPRYLDRTAVGVVLAIVLAACSGTSATPSASSEPSHAATATAVASATATETSPLDGTYQTSFTGDELAASPFLEDAGEINNYNWGEFTLTFSGGRVTLTGRNDLVSFSTAGAFTVADDAVTLVFDTGGSAGETFGFRWSLDGTTLTFQRDESIGPGPTPYLVKPWTAVETYTTTAFSVPLTIIVEPLLNTPPAIDESNLLSWYGTPNVDEAVRFLIPVEVYAPGSSSPQPPPSDYLAYLQGQAADGAAFSDISTITVDGHAGTLMTATTTNGLDGSLGCPTLGADQGEGCFGLQPGLSLRITVIDMGAGTTLLAWAKTGKDAPDDDFVAMFERMLASVRFE